MEQNQIIINEEKRGKSESIPVPNSVDELEAEIEKYIKEKKMYDMGFVVQSVAKYFANWQREQITQGALDAEIEDFPDGSFICKTKNLIDDDMEARGISLFDYASVKILLIKK